MSEIMRDLSPEGQITAIEDNLFAWIPVLGRLGQVHVNEPAGVRRAITDLPIALFNSVMDARLAPGQVDEAIQLIVSDAHARNVPLIWWTGPSTQPADLGEHLKAHGFLFDEDSPGMALDLENLNESLPEPAELSIQPAQDEEALRQWAAVMELGFGASSPSELGVKSWCSIIQAEPGTLLAYTGWLDGKPVATSLLFLAGGVAGIYCVATIPEARRKGIGAWLTAHPLRQAREMGYRIATLQASEMGLGVYRALGFREYCKISTYIWRPEKKGP